MKDFEGGFLVVGFLNERLVLFQVEELKCVLDVDRFCVAWLLEFHVLGLEVEWNLVSTLGYHSSYAY